MNFTPASPLSLSYTPNQIFTTQQEVVFDDGSISFPSNNIITGLPAWLEVLNVYETGGYGYFTLRVKSTYANSMAVGTYSATIQIKYFGPNSHGVLSSTTYNVNLEILEDNPLEISPTVLSYQYVIGSATPQNQSLSITSASNWSAVVSQSWVSLSQNSGVNNGQIFVSVDPTGLTVGQWSAIINITDAGNTRSATVTLTITEGDTDTEFLYVSPQNVQFISEVGVANTNEKTITIESSGNWSANALQSWLNLSTTTGSSGSTSIVLTVDTVSLTDTDASYLGVIFFTQGSIQKILYVELFLIEFYLTGIESEGLYFSDDRNKLQVTNINPNTYLLLEGTLNNGVTNQIYTLKAPYQNGLASVLFGLETNVMLKSVIPTNNFSTRIKNNISPVTINFVASNSTLNSGSQSTFYSWQNVKFLTGKTPNVENKLNYLPKTVYLTKDAVLSLSVISESALSEISINGDVSATLLTVLSGDYLVYNAIVNLSELDLEVGNEITIVFGGFYQKVIIKPSGLEQTILAFENEWREYEFFECTGTLKIADNADQTTTVLQEDGVTRRQIVSIDNDKTYTVSTGHIYSQDEIDWLAYLLKSRRVFIYQDNEPIEIVLSTKSLSTYETRTAFNAYDLKFTKAIIE